MTKSMRPLLSIFALSINFLSTLYIIYFWFFIAKQNSEAKMPLGIGWISVVFFHLIGIILFLLGLQSKTFILLGILSESLFFIFSTYLILYV